MSTVYLITHPDVVKDPELPVPQWPLSERGRERMRAFLSKPLVESIGEVYSSTEQKAVDGGEMLAAHRGLTLETHADLGENDRSATGYMPPDEFAQMRLAFFGRPDENVRGWERAVDAQARMLGAVDRILVAAAGTGDVAIVAHGGVGTLLLCHLMGVPIAAELDQPGANGGNWYAFDADSRRLHHGWQPID